MKWPRLGQTAAVVLALALVGLAVVIAVMGMAAPDPARFLLVAAAAAIGGAIAMATFFARTVGGPMRAMTDTAVALSEGQLDERVPVDGDGTGDVARLGEALNRLAAASARSIAEVRADRDLLASILDGMGEGVLVVDAQERIVLANRALRGMALVGEDVIGKPVLEAIRSAGLKEAVSDAIEGDGNQAVLREIELGRPIPRKLVVRVSCMPVRVAVNEGRRRDDRGAIAVFHDVTDLRRLETIRTDFVANVSHELRTPVTAISTASETLLAGALSDPSDAAEFVDVIDRHAKRLRQLVDDLLDLSKLESKSFRLVLTDLEVAPVLEHAARLLEDPARRRSATIAIDVPDASSGPLRKAKADRRALEQVLLNLLDNAIKYAGDGAHVTLGARVRGEHLEITVVDDGAGIPPVHLGRIFERFYRVDPGRSRDLGGTGLGLSIVKHLVELMGGTIDVESQLGKGARFTIRLQLAST